MSTFTLPERGIDAPKNATNLRIYAVRSGERCLLDDTHETEDTAHLKALLLSSHCPDTKIEVRGPYRPNKKLKYLELLATYLNSVRL
jgi:hypothetical protein